MSNTITEWELERVGTPADDCTVDESGVHCLIHRIDTRHWSKGYSHVVVTVRVDVMETASQTPLRSFVGDGNDVRKAVVNWMEHYMALPVSLEHASYIGWECLRAEMEENYKQD